MISLKTDTATCTLCIHIYCVHATALRRKIHYDSVYDITSYYPTYHDSHSRFDISRVDEPSYHLLVSRQIKTNEMSVFRQLSDEKPFELLRWLQQFRRCFYDSAITRKHTINPRYLWIRPIAAYGFLCDSLISHCFELMRLDLFIYFFSYKSIKRIYPCVVYEFSVLRIGWPDGREAAGAVVLGPEPRARTRQSN